MKIKILEEKYETISEKYDKKYLAKFKIEITKFFFIKTILTVYMICPQNGINMLYRWNVLNENIIKNIAGILCYYDIINILRERAIIFYTLSKEVQDSQKEKSNIFYII